MASAKIKYILELENKANLKPIIAEVQAAATGFDGLKSKIEISARSLGLMQRELTTMQGKFEANKARIKDLEQALQLASISATQDEKANAKLRSELDRLTATNEKLSNSIERKSISIQRGVDNLKKLGQQAGDTGRELQKVDAAAEKQGGALTGLGGQIKNLVGAYLGLEVVTQAAAFAWDGFTLGAGIEQSRLLVQTLTKDVDKGNKTFDAAIAFGQKYGYTQEEMSKSVGQAIGIINKSTQSVDKSIEALARLASINPEQGFEGAVVAMKELETGELTSIADRFNLGKDTARAMFEEIKAGKDPIVVLDEALNKMGVTVDVLANRMQGRNGDLLNMKLGMESLSLAAGDLLDALNISEGISAFANGVGFLALGIQTVTGDTQALTDALIDLQVRGFALGDYDLYVQKMTEAGLADEILSREAYNAANAMIAKGGAARDVSSAVTSLGDAEAVLRDMLYQQVQAGELSEEQLNTLVERTLTLAGATPEATAALLDIVTAMSDSRDGADELTQYLDALAINQEFAASTAYGYADAQVAAYDATVAATDANDVHIASVYDMTDADFQSIEAKLLQQIETEKAAQFERDLATAYDMAGNGALGAAAASLFLADKYNLEASETARLIALHNELTKARGGGMGNAAAGALASTLNRMQTPQTVSRSGGGGGARRSSGGSRGGGGGKSEAVKAAEKEQKDLDKAEKSIETARQNHNKKLEDIDRKHAADLIKINADYIQKALAAEQKFNTDKFNVRNGFKKSLIGVDAELAKQALKEQAALWDESQKIAQAGDATRADEYYQAGLDLIQIRTDNAEALAALDAQIAEEKDAKALEQLQFQRDLAAQVYAEEELLAQQRLERIKNGQDTLKSERDQAIADEQRDYDKARSEADAKFQEDIAKIVEGYDVVDQATERTKQAIIDMANAAVAGLQAVNNVPAGAPASVEAAAGRAMGGFVRANTPYTVGEFGRETFVPRVSGTILNQRQLDRAMNRGTSPTLATPRSSRTETINRNETTLNVTGTAREIVQAEAAIERIAQRVYDRNAKITVNKVITRKPR